jgi:hypothetical protein
VIGRRFVRGPDDRRNSESIRMLSLFMLSPLCLGFSTVPRVPGVAPSASPPPNEHELAADTVLTPAQAIKGLVRQLLFFLPPPSCPL